jgi:hypothetical protein
VPDLFLVTGSRLGGPEIGGSCFGFQHAANLCPVWSPVSWFPDFDFHRLLSVLASSSGSFVSSCSFFACSQSDPFSALLVKSGATMESPLGFYLPPVIVLATIPMCRSCSKRRSQCCSLQLPCVFFSFCGGGNSFSNQ